MLYTQDVSRSLAGTIGDTGLNSAMNGVTAAMNVGLNPHKTPMGIAIAEPKTNPKKTQAKLRNTWSGSVQGLA